jgi:hypothetical protein
MEGEPDHEIVDQNLCVKTTEEEPNKSFSLEASLSKFSYIDLDKELEFKNDLVKFQLLSSDDFNHSVGYHVLYDPNILNLSFFVWVSRSLCTVLCDITTVHLCSPLQFMEQFGS